AEADHHVERAVDLANEQFRRCDVRRAWRVKAVSAGCAEEVRATDRVSGFATGLEKDIRARGKYERRSAFDDDFAGRRDALDRQRLVVKGVLVRFLVFDVR